MSNLHKRAELLANIAIVIVAILLSIVLVKRFVLTSNGPPPNPVIANQLAAGEQVSLQDVEWGKSKQTLLLVLQKGCRYCTESAPFYQRLIKETANRSDVKLVALFPHSVTEGKQYLDELGVSIADIRQVDLRQLKVAGTPTLILVNQSGVATDLWRGKLPAEAEPQVLSKL